MLGILTNHYIQSGNDILCSSNPLALVIRSSSFFPSPLAGSLPLIRSIFSSTCSPFTDWLSPSPLHQCSLAHSPFSHFTRIFILLLSFPSALMPGNSCTPSSDLSVPPLSPHSLAELPCHLLQLLSLFLFSVFLLFPLYTVQPHFIGSCSLSVCPSPSCSSQCP